VTVCDVQRLVGTKTQLQLETRARKLLDANYVTPMIATIRDGSRDGSTASLMSVDA